jgi:hypothetical protein
LSTITELRLVDVEDRHAVDRRVGVVARGRVGDVVGADHERDVGARELGLMSSISLSCVVGHVGLGEQHVHVARHAAGDRVDRVLHLDALRFSSSSASSRTACCACATAMP